MKLGFSKHKSDISFLRKIITTLKWGGYGFWAQIQHLNISLIPKSTLLNFSLCSLEQSR